ncbi:MAG: hypothetical protein RLO12_06760 [Fulvivirga sp.]|uniref:hypothetical protein n=1 Tax=Fulvivirga sp. TaxID=1931237 RepID=UPI0032F80D34
MKELEIIEVIYKSLVANRSKSGIPIHLGGRAIVGTVQDDPFDRWISEEITNSLPKSVEVFHSGSLTTPDLVIRDRSTGTLVGLEIKTLIQKKNGSDSRGLTIDYNSSLPCGSTMVKVGRDTVVIPCFYLFALLDNASRYIVTLIVVDGDFLNYDFDLYKEAKYANYTEYGHGPYGEGSVRHRRMYTYPNPLNSKISEFNMRMILVAKKSDFDKLKDKTGINEQVVRTDKNGNEFYYYMKDATDSAVKGRTLITLRDIFDECKNRKPKERTAAMPSIPD